MDFAVDDEFVRVEDEIVSFYVGDEVGFDQVDGNVQDIEIGVGGEHEGIAKSRWPFGMR